MIWWIVFKIYGPTLITLTCIASGDPNFSWFSNSLTRIIKWSHTATVTEQLIVISKVAVSLKIRQSWLKWYKCNICLSISQTTYGALITSVAVSWRASVRVLAEFTKLVIFFFWNKWLIKHDEKGIKREREREREREQKT